MTSGSPPTAATRIKICCISSHEEARLALEHGADALGFVSAMPSGPGVIALDRIAELIAALPEGTDSFLLTSATDAETIIDQAISTHATTLQLVDALAPQVYAALRAALPAMRLVQVIHVRDADSLAEAREVAPVVDTLLLDSGNPSLTVKELGGTGRVHDWDVSRAICEAVSVPVFLAGGLNATNVAEAIRRVRPYGVDLCSGVRTHGSLDPAKLRAFVDAVAAAK